MALLAFLTPLSIAALVILGIIIFGRMIPQIGHALGRGMADRRRPVAGTLGRTWVRSKGTPRMTLDAFLQAFSRLDLDALLDCFHADATAFFPAEHEPARLDGIDAIGRAFQKVFAKLTASGDTPLSFDAEDVMIDEWGEEGVAIVTFHLRDRHLSRRTLLMRRRAARWRIAHLHASNAAFHR